MQYFKERLKKWPSFFSGIKEGLGRKGWIIWRRPGALRNLIARSRRQFANRPTPFSFFFIWMRFGDVNPRIGFLDDKDTSYLSFYNSSPKKRSNLSGNCPSSTAIFAISEHPEYSCHFLLKVSLSMLAFG